jgi:quercetin dioxygenase-like cupin family protein
MSQIIDIREGELPLIHTFSENVYSREIFMPKNMFVIGHVHNTTHLNIVISGKAKVWVNGELFDIVAPYTFESKAGTRKVLYIIEDMKWQTIHVTKETNIEKLENTLVDRKASENLVLDKKIIKELECHLDLQQHK